MQSPYERKATAFKIIGTPPVYAILKKNIQHFPPTNICSLTAILENAHEILQTTQSSATHSS